MIELITSSSDGKGPKITVIGVGGGGNNAVDRMIEANINGVGFASVNTDSAVLDKGLAGTKVQLGTKLLHGYGAGADPTLGAAAAEESEEDIKRLIEGNDMVIITCGMGGGTGTGAAPVIAKLCKDSGILTVAIVTLPFSFESRPRVLAANGGVEKLREYVDTLLVIPNDKLLSISDNTLTLNDAFKVADSVLKYAIQGISNIVYCDGVINIDFHDLKTTLKDKGIGHLGIGTIDEHGSLMDAVKQAVNSPLLTTTIKDAENILLNTSGNVNLLELNEAVNYIRDLAGEDVNIIWGTVSGDVFDQNKIVVTLIATGMPSENKPNKKPDTVITKPVVRPPIRLTTASTINQKVLPPKPSPNPSIKATEIEIPDFLKGTHSRTIAK